MKKIVFILTILIFVFVTAGCSKTVLNVKDMPAAGIIRVSPSTLFERDTKKLEPHLGLISGCVKVKYAGPKNYINTSYEIWEEGKIKKSSDFVGASIDESFDGEVSISLKNEGIENDEQKYRLTAVVGGASGSGIVQDIKIPADSSRSPKNIDSAIEISDDKEIPIWGYLAHKGGSYSYRTGESFEEAAQKASWAFVFKIYMSDKSKELARKPYENKAWHAGIR